LAFSSSNKGKDLDPIIADPAAWEARFKRVVSIRKQFLNAYQRRRPVSRQRVALWEALNLFYFVVSGWTKAKTGEVALSVRLLDRFLLESRLVETGVSSNR
jgi:Ser/Thr protein kinase RdoA (MazF antagonist)